MCFAAQAPSFLKLKQIEWDSMVQRWMNVAVYGALILIGASAFTVTRAGCPRGDFNNDCRVDMEDCALLAEAWLDGAGINELMDLSDAWLEKKEYAVINEFLASNHDILFDEDEDSSDWIEIYNPTQAAMSLGGWYLTDDRDDLMKWGLPDVTLEGGEFLTVFASGKDRRNAEGELHTNFQLSADDQYLALVENDGETVASFYEAGLDERRMNVSYGINQQAMPSYRIGPGYEGKVLIPDAVAAAAIGSAWTGTAVDEPFDESAWICVSTPMGYDTRNSASENIALGKPAAQSSEWGGYPAGFATDGIFSNFTHTAMGDLTPWWEIDLLESYFINRVVLHNRDSCCQNRLYNITVEIFNAQDILVYISPILNQTEEGETPVDPGAFITVDLSSFPGGGVTGRRVHVSKTVINGGGQQEYISLGEVEIFGLETYKNSIVSDIESQMKGVNASCYLRFGFDVAEEDDYEKIVLRMKYDDGFIAYLNGREFASSNTPDGTVGYNATAQEIHYGVAFEEYSVPLSLLRKGKNILAIHGLNYEADDENFLLVPELISYRTDVSGTGFFTEPTPGKLNGTSVAGFVSDTTFDIDRGFYDSPFEVNITSPTPGATIVYTTDGSEPTMSNGKQVQAADGDSKPVAIVHVDKTTVLRARAFKSGYEPTNTDTHTYIFLDHVISTSVMNPSITQDPIYGPQMRDALKALPTMSIVTKPGVLEPYLHGPGPYPSWTYDEIPVSVEWIMPDGSRGFQEDAGAARFGGHWYDRSGAYRPFDKWAFRIYFRSEYGETKLKFPLFEGFDHGIDPVDTFDQLELYAGSHDMSERGFYMSSQLTADTMLEMGNINPHGRFVHLYINGAYWGQYNLRERWNADMNARYLGGEKEEYESIKTHINVGGWGDMGEPYDGDGSVWQLAISFRNSYESIKPYLDVQNYVDFMLMYMFGNSEAEYRCVGPKVPGGGGFKFWLNDADGFTRDVENRTGESGPGGIFGGLTAEEHPDFEMLLADRIHKHFFNDGDLTSSVMASRLLKRCEEIELSFLGEAARWGYRSPASWANARDNYINSILPSRSETLLNQLRNAGFYPQLDAPVFQINGLYKHGGTVDFNAVFSMSLPGDSSYQEIRLVEKGHPVKVHIPVDNTLGLTWVERDYVPTNGWTDGLTGAGVGYEAGSGYENWIETDVFSAMRGVSSSVFCIMEFMYDGRIYDKLMLDMRYDDGFVAYLNGDEITRSDNIDNDIPGTAFAFGHEAQSTYEGFDVSEFRSSLVLGRNILAIHGINSSSTSSDMLVLPRLIGLVQESNPVNDPVWYTVDGSDPRLSDGYQNPESRQYSEPFLVDHSIIVKARTLVEGQWSALNEAVFGVGPVKESLRITEL
ncbi:MAG: chitobiase/beta-hexosaminidase C-terminal domain-containing protein, partial [Sedimentisphaerales bacterium]|nr:chitobiase/beta-hexosaminidase C-terminal domain-containing protein [Sedimentisphaerales bacterium]